MARVVVDVMLKPEILDPQGQAVANALPRLGVSDVASVRIGRRVEIEFEGEADLERAREIADKLLANPVIEDLRGQGRVVRDRCGDLPRVAGRPGRGPGRAHRRCRGGAAVARRPGPARRRRRGPARAASPTATICAAAPSPGSRPVMEIDRRRPPATACRCSGICNGFQILCEAHLLPGALTRNQHLHFRNRDQWLRVETGATAWTNEFTRGPGDRHPGEERRGLLRRRRDDAGPARGQRPDRRPLRRAATRTVRCATSPRSATRRATWSASCRTRSTRSRR